MGEEKRKMKRHGIDVHYAFALCQAMPHAYERITTQAQNNVAPTKINHRDRYAIIWLWLELKCKHPYIRKYIRTKAATATTQSDKDMMLSMAGACGWLMLVVGLAACIHGSKQNGTHVVTSYM